MIKKKSKLRKIDKKYCKCLLKVRSTYLKKNVGKEKILSPYGICTKSVYFSKNKKRPKNIKCSKNYNFYNLNFKTLKSYGIEKKVKTRNKGKYITKNKLLKNIFSKMPNLN